MKNDDFQKLHEEITDADTNSLRHVWLPMLARLQNFAVEKLQSKQIKNQEIKPSY